MENSELDKRLELLGDMLALYGKETRASAVIMLSKNIEHFSTPCLEKAIQEMLRVDKFFSVARFTEFLDYQADVEAEEQEQRRRKERGPVRSVMPGEKLAKEDDYPE